MNDEKDFEAVTKFVRERVLENSEILFLNDISKIYEKNNGKQISKIQLENYLAEKFGNDISVWTPKYGEKFCFDSTIEKGEIIERFMREIDRLKRQKEKIPTLQEKLNDAASFLRNEIKSAAETFIEWPPDEDSLINCETEVPSELFKFIVKIVHQNAKLSERKANIVNSLCQDLLYCYSNGSIRTKKHAYLGLCLKRKTGCKECLIWLNRLGHSISYDEVIH